MVKKVYLDYAATTPVDPRVIKAMMPYFAKKYGNTMSLHVFGREASQAIENSRKIVADYINAKPEEIYFTSSATESNNLALKGVAFANRQRKKHLIVSRVEHDCVLESSRWLRNQGFEVDYLSVDKHGLVDVNKLKKLIKKETLLVSVIHGNNEVGTIQDIANIGKLCQKKGVYFHTDVAQSLGKVKINVSTMNIDLLTASSHKIYGPKGAACLYVRNGVIIEPIIHGGGHERGLRSSTSNVAAIAGFAKAVEILKDKGDKENKRITYLRDYLIEKILKKIQDTQLNGDKFKRLSNNINISFFGVEGESLLLELDHYGIAVSTGSACSSKTLEPSHVLLALGLSPAEAHGSLRISLGRWTTKTDIEYFINILVKSVKKLRKISPAYVLH
ncbi:cysteine desulfurase NifS [Candidatus Roizmanbacteria bacterium CG02_land_8_20_14_3_00_36_15]|uniref:cysteine desulfurase n=2 Tax=Candidatus Roizmaniibacteriota TaxID=1752723 RepID=A0A2M8KJT0_9BACT|nr:MAG: cysteine desulfurase NifS [Candidatus Roizmanbacteria bacterium CG03_land_8_20_14_0_80_36_21]PIV38170.1 MAG: cysteine desulfurase NifS [Candidatus Roizmanbacteria bacterium CG02_land_8_20_14_3_00_36_15]PIY69595.1 MAG: cysteine desulfurase NifS [Candidatus Roizmanbacteria bacterium CG_4_10_14_0_8_um_filter_36_36]PJA53683.1 MAG: cysteine desulfurase NifS [Candidatus Roizmanbacteria bacterium CG_4_9_14_3_um_filter_36_11]PJC82205.1 MAG: cysteine desulfurase NifS [Candidatus Roizmanbacteria 